MVILLIDNLGCVYDLSNSYSATFLSAGVMFVVAGILGIGISYAHRHQRSLYKNEGIYTFNMLINT